MLVVGGDAKLPAEDEEQCRPRDAHRSQRNLDHSRHGPERIAKPEDLDRIDQGFGHLERKKRQWEHNQQAPG